MGIVLDVLSAIAKYTALAVAPLVLYIISVVGYRLAFDPLREYPGPFAAKITHGYAGLSALKKRLHLDTYHAHLKYGSVVRIAPDRLVFNTVTALDDILLNPRVTKGRPYLGARLNPTPSLFDTLDREQHRQKRKVIAPVISDRAMRTFEPTANSQLDAFLRLLLSSAQKGETVNMSPRCQMLTADVVGHLAFGYALNTQTDAEMQFIPQVMTGLNTMTSIYMAWPAIKSLDPIIRLLGRRRIMKYRRVLQAMIRSRMTRSKNEDGKTTTPPPQDLYAAVAGDEIAEQALRGTELWSEATFFMAAGASTISSLLAAMFFYLSDENNRRVYDRLATEIRAAFVSGRDIRSGPILGGCRYLRAVIDETLRMSPASIGTLWRQLDPSVPQTQEPFVVDGHVIPPGVAVGISPYSLLHNDAYFNDPFTFKPERFLEETEEKDKEVSRHAFAPFALGDRNCAGRALAYLEASLTIAKTIWFFDFERAEGEAGKVGAGWEGAEKGRHRTGEFQLFDVVGADHDGPNLIFKTREGGGGTFGLVSEEGEGIWS